MSEISVEELHERLLKHQELHVLDVREPDEYEVEGICTRCLPLSRLLQMDAQEIEDWKNEEIIVHCYSGKRSLQACLLLETLGFSQVTNLKGGIKEWKEKYCTSQIGQ